MRAIEARKSACLLIALLLLPLLYAWAAAWFPVHYTEESLLAAVREELEFPEGEELTILGRAEEGERRLFIVGKNRPGASTLSLSPSDYLPVYCSEFGDGLVLEHIARGGMYEAGGAEGLFYDYTGVDGFSFLVLNPDCAAIVLTGSSFGTREIAVTGLPFFHYESGVFENADGDDVYSFRFLTEDGEEL